MNVIPRRYGHSRNVRWRCHCVAMVLVAFVLNSPRCLALCESPPGMTRILLVMKLKTTGTCNSKYQNLLYRIIDESITG